MGFKIENGIGIINGEPVTEHVDVLDRDSGLNFEYRVRRMQIDCGNGYRLSVVFGTDTFCHNQWLRGETFHEESPTAEIAILDPLGDLDSRFEEEWGSVVKGWQTPEDVLKYLAIIREWSPVE